VVVEDDPVEPVDEPVPEQTSAPLSVMVAMFGSTAPSKVN